MESVRQRLRRGMSLFSETPAEVFRDKVSVSATYFWWLRKTGARREKTLGQSLFLLNIRGSIKVFIIILFQLFCM